MSGTYSFTGSNFQNFGGETDRALDAKLFVLGTVDKIGGDYGVRIYIRLC